MAMSEVDRTGNIEQWTLYACPRCGRQLSERKWCSGPPGGVHLWHPMALADEVKVISVADYKGVVEALRLIESVLDDGKDDKLSRVRLVVNTSLRPHRGQ